MAATGDALGSGGPPLAARPGASRRDPAAPADGVPDPQAALRPLHPGDGAATPAASASRISTISPGPSSRTPGASAPPASPTPSAGLSTPWAPSSSAPQRFCNCCWATWVARAAASWRCAGTPASRARPTFRRCSTCCPATCRCPRRARTTPSPTTSTRSGRRSRRASGPTPTPTWSACSRRGGATPPGRTTTGPTTTCPG